MFTLLFLSALGGGWGEEPVKENGGADDDDDGDGLTNREEIEVYGSDPNLFSFYQDELIIVTAGVTPSDPTSLEENIRVYAIVISSTPIKPVNSLNFSVVLNYKTLTKNLKEEEMTLRVPKSLSRDSVITEWKPQAFEGAGDLGEDGELLFNGDIGHGAPLVRNGPGKDTRRRHPG